MRPLEDDLRIFMVHLTDAGARMKGHCFRLPTDTDSTFHDRAYCLELYHQLRVILGEDSPYTINDCPEDTGHADIPGERKPDLLVQVRGGADGRLAALSVKPSNALRKDIKKEIVVLDRYLREEPRFFRAMILIYGDERKNAPAESLRAARQLIRRFNEKIMLLWHKGQTEKLQTLE